MSGPLHFTLAVPSVWNMLPQDYPQGVICLLTSFKTLLKYHLLKKVHADNPS